MTAAYLQAAERDKPQYCPAGHDVPKNTPIAAWWTDNAGAEPSVQYLTPCWGNITDITPKTSTRAMLAPKRNHPCRSSLLVSRRLFSAAGRPFAFRGRWIWYTTND
jgi:hypothetical protein